MAVIFFLPDRSSILSPPQFITGKGVVFLNAAREDATQRPSVQEQTYDSLTTAVAKGVGVIRVEPDGFIEPREGAF